MQRQLSKLKDHFIICGYGRIGETIAKELMESNIPLVVIEQDEKTLQKLDESGILYVAMDATKDDALIAAGVKRARGLVTAVSSDANNVFITLTAHCLKSDLFILARTFEPGNEDKLIRAGASKVVSPYKIGAKRMAAILTKPTVVDFIEQAMNTEIDLLMEQATVSSNSEIVDKSLVDLRLRNTFGVVVIAIKPVVGEMVFNPSADHIIRAGDVLIVIGKKENIQSMDTVLT